MRQSVAEGRQAVLHVAIVVMLALVIAVAAATGIEQARAAYGRDGAYGARDAIWRRIFARPSGPAPGATSNAQRVELGRELFDDGRLSGSGSGSCAGCHRAELAYTDGQTRGVGNDGHVLERNVPQLMNIGWAKALFWDGRAASLEEQARGPILAVRELAGNFDQIVASLSTDPGMRSRFAAAFPDQPAITEAGIVSALAAYQRSLVSGPTRFDAWVLGDDQALSIEEQAGFDVFVGKGGCVSCHGGWRFTDDTLHDIGLNIAGGTVVSGDVQRMQFKTPSLRELNRTAPYMHDGRFATLGDVVDHYSDGVIERPTLALTLVRNLSLTKDEKQAVVAFLKTLSQEK